MHLISIFFLPAVFLLSRLVASRAISGIGFELQMHEDPLRWSLSLADEFPRSMTRRASQSTHQPPNTNSQPNGWVSCYTPILPFDSTDRSAAHLERFYDLLKSEITTLIAQNYPRDAELELVDNQIRLDIRTIDHNNLNLTPIPDYQIVLDFLAYIIAKTKRGYTGKYRVLWVKANVTVTFTLLLGALAVGALK